jgi:hypothetical protein
MDHNLRNKEKDDLPVGEHDDDDAYRTLGTGVTPGER